MEKVLGLTLRNLGKVQYDTTAAQESFVHRDVGSYRASSLAMGYDSYDKSPKPGRAGQGTLSVDLVNM